MAGSDVENPSEAHGLDAKEAIRLLMSQRGMLSGYIASITGDPVVAEDVFQELSILVLEKHADIHGPRAFPAWARTAARHLAMRQLRKRGREPMALSADVIEVLDNEWEAGRRHRRRNRSASSPAHLPRQPDAALAQTRADALRAESQRQTDRRELQTTDQHDLRGDEPHPQHAGRLRASQPWFAGCQRMSTTQTPPDDRAFDALAMAYLDGQAEADQVRELDERLRDDRAARRRFTKISRQHGLMMELLNQVERPLAETTETGTDDVLSGLAEAAATAPVGRIAPTPPVESRPVVSDTARRAWTWFNRPWPVNLAAALALVVTAFGMVWMSIRLFNPPKPAAVAQLTQTEDAVWGGERRTLWSGDKLLAGDLHLQSGRARINFEGGADIILEGPAVFTLEDRSRGYLKSGRLSARVPQQAIGFSVGTPTGDVIDRGTEFGVAVATGGDLEVHVFQGRVELHNTAGSGDSVDLRENAATHVNAKTGKVKKLAVAPTQFRRRLASPGIAWTSPGMRYLSPALRSVIHEYLEDAQHLILFEERAGVRLGKDLPVMTRSAGVHKDFSKNRATIQAGTRVRSFLIHCDPPGRPGERERVFLSGTVTFDRPILGLIVTHAGLRASDKLLGNPDTVYATPADRGLEGAGGEKMLDAVIVSQDRKTVTLSTQTASSIDQVRVILPHGPASPSKKRTAPKRPTKMKQEAKS